MQIPGKKKQLLQVQKSAMQFPGKKTCNANCKVQKSAMQTPGSKTSYANCKVQESATAGIQKYIFKLYRDMYVFIACKGLR